MGRKRTASQTVYVIAAGNRAIKVGIATNVRKRLGQIRTACPDDARIVRTFCGDKYTEMAFHWHLRKYRIRGEWFRVKSLEVLDSIPYRKTASVMRRELSSRPGPHAPVQLLDGERAALDRAASRAGLPLAIFMRRVLLAHIKYAE